MMLLEPLLHIAKVSTNRDQFEAKVRWISMKLGIDPNWLMQAMFQESSLNHRAVNSRTGATGLIQFMPSTAARLGTTTADLLQMSNVEQLDYVYEYLKPYRWKMWGFVDVYFAIFFPAAIGKPASYELKTSTLSAPLIASQNPGYDLDNNGTITAGEVEAAVLANVPQQYRDSFKKKATS